MKDKTAKLGKFRLDSKNATTDELLEAKKAIKFSKNNSVTIDMTNPAAGAISVVDADTKESIRLDEIKTLYI